MKVKFIKSYLLIITFYGAALLFYSLTPAHASNLNGFELSRLSIDRSEIFSGGPDRDGIPSIDKPKFIAPNQVNFLSDDDLVISFTQDNITKAYPLRILIWHEIVNDMVNNRPISITYCPLCGTAMVFDRRVDNKVLSFGVSGLLYRSDVLMYDRESESLWTQLGMKGVSNTALNKKLKWLPSVHMTWSSWKKAFPNGQVLSTDTGYKRHYAGQAYASYFASKYAMFPVPDSRKELPDKDKVIGLIINGKAKAYPTKRLLKENTIIDSIDKTKITIQYNPSTKSTVITDANGKQLPSVEAYWFAWQGFYPNTQIGLGK